MSTRNDATGRMDRVRKRPRPTLVLAVALALLLIGSLWLAAENLSVQGRWVLTVLVLATLGWTATDLPDAIVALAAILALAAGGVIAPKVVYGSLGHELIWLLVATFVLAAVLRASGIAEHAVMRATGQVHSVAGLMRVLNLAIVATALVIPSTSARAALLVPVFLALTANEPDRRIVTALALLIPTSILLSAGGSLIGAGAHLFAADLVAGAGGPRLDYARWLLVGMPFALLSSCLATEIVIRLALPSTVRGRPMVPRAAQQPLVWTRHRQIIVMVLALLVTGWVTAPLHGAPVALLALTGALTLTWPGVSGTTLKQGLAGVEWELILFLAATMVLGEAILSSGAANWATATLVGWLGEQPSTLALLGLVIGSALGSHLLINSRTARATVLLPTLALPLAGAGVDVTTLVLIVVMGTGFCQTFAHSAKPVALFSSIGVAPYGSADLLRLALMLAPLHALLLLLFAMWVWPLVVSAISS